MSQKDLHYIFAVVLLVCVTIVFFIDMGSEFDIYLANRMKYGLVWIILRYVGIICAVLLALDVVFDKEIFGTVYGSK